ncbi:MAG: hypothetical protein WDA02_03035 [Saccharofermentanales bacterium]
MKIKILSKLKEKNIVIKENIIINDNDESVTSRIDGTQRKRIYGKYLKSIGLTSEEYKILFPDAPLMAKSDYKNTTKNSGQHMKQEKYKRLFSEKIKGCKNPNHKSKTTEKERKERSPFSKDFYKNKYKNITDKDIDYIRKNFIKDFIKDRVTTTQIDYYLNKGYDEKTSKKMLSERQKTFSLDLCIKKYGNDKGKEIWNNRQIKWQKSLLQNGNLKCGYSKISQKLFYDILNKYNINDKSYIYFATKNQEYYLSGGKELFYQYDFVDLKNKKIIEYNGDQYHANPKIYESNDNPHPFRKNITAQEIWDKDNNKIQLAHDNGFEVLIVWDSEYKENKEIILKKCLNFLNINKK